MKDITRRNFLKGSAATAALAALAGCQTPGSSTDAPAADKYPIEPEEWGSGTVRYTLEETQDGWTRVTNEGGATLGVMDTDKLIQVNGYAFKDLDGSGKLDLWEDWSQSKEDRAAAIAEELSFEEISGLMLFSAHQFSVEDEVSDSQKEFLDAGVRAVLSAAASTIPRVQAAWNNDVQAYVEGLGHGIPVNISTDPRQNGTDVSKWPGNLALAATFDPEVAFDQGNQLAKEFRALGITTLLGPQMDLATDPRWPRDLDTYGEDPALSRDLTEANVSGYQSTYDADGNDQGWGAESVTAMVKHWPGDGMGESGRESHGDSGKYAVYPGGNFKAHLIPFVDGGMDLKRSSTGSAASMMSSYSIAYSEDGEYGELVGSAFSEYKLQLLRSYGFDGTVCSDWGVVGDMPLGENFTVSAAWGVEDLTQGERCYKALMAGIDQFGGLNTPEPVQDAYKIGVEKLGEDAIMKRFRESARRLLKNYFYVGLFDNPYVDSRAAAKIVGSDEAFAAGLDAQLKGIVMLKNDGAIAQGGPAHAGDKPKVYVPMVYTPTRIGAMGSPVAATAEMPVELNTLENYFDVVTDTLADTLTGDPDEDGNPTIAPEDLHRATADEIADCDFSLAIIDGPTYGWSFMGIGIDSTTGEYLPLSMQYGEYTADGPHVREESISGDTLEDGSKQNRSYAGHSSTASVSGQLATVQCAQTIGEGKPCIVCVNASNPLVLSEVEPGANALLVGFNVDNKAFLDVVAGNFEPCGLLPMQFPRDMDAVEAQLEDVPRDMDCYVDAAGNEYDFAFGLNWSGVIHDDRVSKYGGADPLTEPQKQPQNA